MTIREALSNMSIFIGSQGMEPLSAQAMFYLNRARRLVYPLDDWTHTIKYGCVQLTDCCFILPEDCAAVRAAWSGRDNIDIVNEYFDAVDQDYVVRNCGDKAKFFRTGRTLPAPFLPTDQMLFFRAENMDDAGKKVTITYKDFNRNLVSETLTLLTEFQAVNTAANVSEIKALGKERTVGVVEVMEVSGKTAYSMQPEFTCGRFEEYKIDGQLCCNQALVKCKLRFRDYTTEDLDSLLDIESIDALEFAAKAMYEKSQSNIAEYQQNLLLARTHLEIAKENLESSNRGYSEMRLPGNTQRDEHRPYC